MSSPLHPDLQMLRQRYDELLHHVDAGHLTAENAISTLETMVAVDALGAEWRINAEGVFMRNMPGAERVFADPRQFHSIGIRSSAALDSVTLSQPPIDPYRSPVAGPYTAPFTTSPPSEPQPTRRSFPTKLPSVRIPASVGRRRRPIIIVACSMIAVAVIVGRGGSGVIDNTPAPVVAAPSEQSPSKAQAAAVVDALTSGRAAAKEVLPTGSVAELLGTAGNLAAAEALGFDVRAGELRITGTAVAVDVDVYDGDTLVAAWSLPLTGIDGRWVAAGPATSRN